MTPARFLKVTTVTSATLALLAGTAVSSAYAQDIGAQAPSLPAISEIATGDGFSTLFEPGATVKTTDGLLVATAASVEINPDQTIQGASGVSTYDLNKIVLELNGKTVKANANAATNSGSEPAYALGAWDTNNTSVVTVDANGNLTAVENGTASVGFIPAVIEGETVTYPDALFVLDVTVANGVITVAEPAPADGGKPLDEAAPTAGIPVGTPLKLADGALFYISDKPTLGADGTSTGMVTIPREAFDGTVMEIKNLDSLTVGSIVDAGADYTNAVGRDAFADLLAKNPNATLGGVLSSSDESVISVKDNVATVVGAGSATLTFTSTMVRDNVVVESDLVLSYTINVESSSTGPAPAPSESAPAPSESAPAPSESAPAPSESAPAPSESAPAPSESAPAPSESVPAPSESAPAPSESAPAPSESAPAPSESAPAPSESAPAPSESAPVVKVTTNPSVAPASPSDKPFTYENCAAVYDAGAAPISKGDYGWDDSLDSDNDGVGCELTPDYANDDASKKDSQAATQSSQNKKQLANTGAEATAPLAAGLGLLALGAGAVAVSRRRRRNS